MATPYLGIGIGALSLRSGIGSYLGDPPGVRQVVLLFMSGGIVSALLASGWEFTVNANDRPEIKAEVILGSSAIGGTAAVVGALMSSA